MHGVPIYPSETSGFYVQFIADANFSSDVGFVLA